MRTLKMTNLVLAGSLAFNGVANASLPRSAKENPQERSQRGQVTADRVAIFASGRPVCQANLSELPRLKPKFIEMSVKKTSRDEGPLGSLRACEGTELAALAQMADLVDSGNRVAALPLMIVPVVVCVAGVAAGAWAGYESGRLMITDSTFLYSTYATTGAAEALATLMTGALKLPANYAAAYGGLIGASCGMVGSVVGFFYFESKSGQ